MNERGIREKTVIRRRKGGRTRQASNGTKPTSRQQVADRHRTSGIRLKCLRRPLPGQPLAHRSCEQNGSPAAVRRVERYLGRWCRRQGHEQPTFANDDRNHFVDAQSSRLRCRVRFDYSAALSVRQPPILSRVYGTGGRCTLTRAAQWHGPVRAPATVPRARASRPARRPRQGARRPPNGS